MKLDLTAQFIREFEELRRKAETSARSPSDEESPPAASREAIERLETEVQRFEAEVKGHRAEVERLEGEARELEQANLRLVTQHQIEIAQKEAELKRSRVKFVKRLAALKEGHADELERKKWALNQLSTELATREKEGVDSNGLLEAELLKKSREREEQVKKKTAAERAEMLRLCKAKLSSSQIRWPVVGVR